jgi:hypothetical protein
MPNLAKRADCWVAHEPGLGVGSALGRADVHPEERKILSVRGNPAAARRLDLGFPLVS